LKFPCGQRNSSVFGLYYVQRVASILSLLLLAAAAAWSVWLARADAVFRQPSPGGFAQAVEMVPFNADYLRMQALQVDYDGGDAEPFWQRAALLTPRASAPRIRLGLLAEQRGAVADAERWLLEAYSVDHQFETRWTLANFYLRQQREPEFWKWMRLALEFSYGDRTPAFDLCWRMSDDVSKILVAVPNAIRADHLHYVTRRHPAAIAAAAAGVDEEAALLEATGVLLQGRRFEDAVVLWQQSGRAAPHGVSNSDFASPPSGQGFDWAILDAPGVTHAQPAAGRGHRIRLNGKQPEELELIRQTVGGLRPHARYRLQTVLSGDPVAGLEWRIDGKAIGTATPELFESTSPAHVLSLWYRRPLGEVRAEATFDLRQVQLMLAE
jgi:hypothetical protein